MKFVAVSIVCLIAFYGLCFALDARLDRIDAALGIEENR